MPFTQAQINYAEKYMLLFSAFNAWYRMVTGERTDARALQRLKYRDALWVEYRKGECLELLRPLVRKLVILTSVRPVTAHGEWSGVVRDADDWVGVIQFWYAVRCAIVHSNSELQSALYPTYVSTAYESLNIFMTEIVMRLKNKDLVFGDDPDISLKYGNSLFVHQKHADLFSRQETSHY